MTRAEIMALVDAEVALASRELARSREASLAHAERMEAMVTGLRAANRASHLVAFSRTAQRSMQRERDDRRQLGE